MACRTDVRRPRRRAPSPEPSVEVPEESRRDWNEIIALGICLAFSVGPIYLGYHIIRAIF